MIQRGSCPRLMSLLKPLAVRLMEANINRDRVANVMKAGIIVESATSGSLGIIKGIRGARSAGAVAGDRQAVTG